MKYPEHQTVQNTKQKHSKKCYRTDLIKEDVLAKKGHLI